MRFGWSHKLISNCNINKILATQSNNIPPWWCSNWPIQFRDFGQSTFCLFKLWPVPSVSGCEIPMWYLTSLKCTKYSFFFSWSTLPVLTARVPGSIRNQSARTESYCISEKLNDHRANNLVTPCLESRRIGDGALGNILLTGKQTNVLFVSGLQALYLPFTKQMV